MLQQGEGALQRSEKGHSPCPQAILCALCVQLFALCLLCVLCVSAVNQSNLLFMACGSQRSRRGLPIKYFADFLRDGFQVEGLLQVGDAAFEDAVAEDAVVGVAGDEKDFDVGPLRRDARGQLAAAEPWHDDV